MSSLRKIAAHFALCPRTGLIPRAVLTFDADGTLISIENDVSKMDSLHGIEFYSGILIPGMVNTHCHLELSYMRGMIPRGTGLTGFVEEISSKRNTTAMDERIHAADVQDALMRREGIVAVGDICNGDSTFPLKQKSKIDYLNFVEVYGSDPGVAASRLSAGQEVMKTACGMGLSAVLTPHSTYSLSNGLFADVVAENGDKKPLSIHFMESRDEAALFQGQGGFAGQYRRAGLDLGLERYGSPAGRLVDSISGDVPLLLIHNTFVSEEDIDRINNHFNRVTWVVCPRSNDYIEGALPPLDLLRRKGCRIAIGTDSLSSNSTLSLSDELKYMTTHYDVPFAEMASWATQNGAEALGLESSYGTFEVGKHPGAVLIDNIDWDTLSLTNESTIRCLV